MGRAINEDELFFHHVRSKDLDDLTQSIAAKIPLFSLRGRATLRRGNPFLKGDVFAFIVPIDEQAHVLESPYQSGYEVWGEGSQQILALKNSVPPEQQETAKRWLEKQQQKNPPNSPVYEREIPLEDVRTLDPRYFVGHLKVEGHKEIKRLDGHKDHLPKQVKFSAVIPPRADVSIEEIQRAIKRAVLKGNTIL